MANRPLLAVAPGSENGEPCGMLMFVAPFNVIAGVYKPTSGRVRRERTAEARSLNPSYMPWNWAEPG